MSILDPELRQVLEGMTDGILAVDQRGHIVFANRALEAMSGYTFGDLVNLHVEALVPRAERESHERKRLGYQQAARPPRPMGTGLDIRLHRRNGSQFAADVALSPVRTASGSSVVIAAIREKSQRGDGGNSDSQIQRLERDLHERALQTLFALSLNLQTMAAQLPDQALSPRLEDAVHQIDDVARDLRNYIFGLRPGILSNLTPGQEDPDRS